MPATYVEELSEWVKERRPSRSEKNLVAFLALRDDIEAALDSGYSMRTIWAHMFESGRITLQYDMFRNYVNRHIKNRSTPIRPKHGRAKPEVAPTKAAPAPHIANGTNKPDVVVGFTFNAVPNKEELL